MEACTEADSRLDVSRVGIVRGTRRLFGNVTFRLEPGGLVWIQGSNGSGKTTLLRSLCGLAPVMSGDIRWRDIPIARQPESYRRELIYIGHANGLKEDLSALENLRIAAELAGQTIGREMASHALQDAGLAGREHLPLKFLSQGQRRRVALARLWLVPARRLWLLDEPFNALDAAAVENLRALMERHLGNGGMIVLTTHQDVDILADDTQIVRLAS